jgi:hypothetical protein
MVEYGLGVPGLRLQPGHACSVPPIIVEPAAMVECPGRGSLATIARCPTRLIGARREQSLEQQHFECLGEWPLAQGDI